MRKVYVSGALTDIQNRDEVQWFYERIGSLCTELGFNAHVPHLYTDPLKNADLRPQDVYKTDKAAVRAANIIIAYVGLNSLGVGIELGWADEWNIPIILLYEAGKKVSRLPRGIPNIAAEVTFESFDEGLVLLKQVLVEKFTSGTVKEESLLDDGELHVRVNGSPDSNTQMLIVFNSIRHVIFNEPVPSITTDTLKRVANALSNKGIRPQRIYVEPFDGLVDKVSSVWSNARVLYEYQ